MEKDAKNSKHSKSSKTNKESKESNQKRDCKDNKENGKERNVRDLKRVKERRNERDERSERNSRSEREGRTERKSKGEHDERRERERAGYSKHGERSVHDKRTERDGRTEHGKKGERESRRDRESNCESDNKHKHNSRSEHESKTKHKSKSHSESRSEHERKCKKEHTKSTKDTKEDRSECASKHKKLSKDMREVSDEEKDRVATENTKTATEDIKELIMRSLECELGGHILEARMLYEESLIKLESCSTDETNEEMWDCYRKYLNTYEKHVQRLRDQIEQSLFGCKIIEHITIPEGVRGRSFQKLFGCYLDEKVTLVHIYEPCLTQSTQLEHLINFVEVLIKNCPNLMFVRVITRASPSQLQSEVLHGLREEVEAGNISFNYQFDEQLQKPHIILNTGVVIRCRRGLNIYKPMTKYYKLGLYDYDYRRCESCEIDVYQGKPFSETISKADRTDLMESLLHH